VRLSLEEGGGEKLYQQEIEKEGEFLEDIFFGKRGVFRKKIRKKRRERSL